MVVAAGASVAGKMLQARHHAAVRQTAGHDAHKTGAQVRVSAERARTDDSAAAGGHVGHGCKVKVEAQRAQRTRHDLPCVVYRRGICLVAVLAHRADGIGLQRRVLPQTADRAAFFINTEKQPDAAVGSGVLQHGYDLFAVFQVLRKVDDPAHRFFLQRLAGRIAGARDGIIAGERFGRDKKQLPDLFLQCHGGKYLRGQRAAFFTDSGCLRARTGGRSALRFSGRRGGIIRRVFRLCLLGQLALVRVLALRLDGNGRLFKHAVRIQRFHGVRLALLRQCPAQKPDSTCHHRQGQNDKNCGKYVAAVFHECSFPGICMLYRPTCGRANATDRPAQT